MRILNTLPERGSYSRIGACPYLSPQLINSRFCPCKGRISLAVLAPQHLSRYEPPSGALAPQVRDIRAALRGLKAQQVRSPGHRPGLTYVPHLRPVRAKVINNRCAHTFALTGRVFKIQKKSRTIFDQINAITH